MPDSPIPDTFREWMLAEYHGEEDTITDIASHGCAAGFGGLTYYSDTCRLYDQYEDEIWSWLDEMSADLGEPHALAMVAKWNGAQHVTSGDHLKNLLVWAYAEHTANALSDERPWDDEDDEPDEPDEA